jgi:hypothetical protein
MIETPGIYDLTDDEYHADPCDPVSASCSILNLIDTRSPQHAMWQHPKLNPTYQPDNDKKYDLGSAFHVMITGRGRDIVPIDAPDWRTKEARQQRDNMYRMGKIPLLGKNYVLAKKMFQEATIQLENHEGYVQGEPEKSMFWQENGYWFRIRPDVLATDQDVILDYKATEISVAPESYQRHIYNSGYDLRAAFYARGYEKVMGRPLREYRFVAVEVEPPHALAIFSLTPEAMAFAGKRVERAIGIWKGCLATNIWPAYPRRICYVTPPKWQENAQIEREITETSNSREN